MYSISVESPDPEATFAWSSQRTIISAIGLAFIFLAAFWHDFVKFYVGFDFNRTLVFFGGVALCGLVASRQNPVKVIRGTPLILAFPLYCIVIALVHIAAGAAPGQNLTFYVAPIAALVLLYIDRKLIIAFLAATVLVSAGLEAIELLTCKYFYVWNGPGGPLDEQVWMGSTHTLRAKGLFASPLISYYVCLVTLLLTGLGPRLLVVSVLTSIFGISKAGIVINGALVALATADKNKVIRSIVAGGIAVGCVLALAYVVRQGTCVLAQSGGAFSPSLAQEKVRESIQGGEFNLFTYLTSIVNLGTSVNETRFYYWQLNLDRFLNFSAFHMLFGDPHLSYRLTGEGTESSVLMELMDFGIIGFALLTHLKILVLRKLFPVSKKICLFALGVMILALAQPIYTNLGNYALFWLFLLTVLRGVPEQWRMRDAGYV